MAKHFSKQDFINRAKEVHGNKYDYSKVEYINSKTKIRIVCPIHGEFWQEANSHLQGSGCPSCVGLKKPSSEEFIKKAKSVHGDKYDYSEVDYVNSQTKISIICPIHGKFFQKPNDHLNGQCCPRCKAEKFGDSKRYSLNEFIERAKKVHGDKYDYSKAMYSGSLNPISIICPKHGEFTQRPVYHLIGHGCPICNESHLERDIRLILEKEGIVYISGHHFSWLNKQHLDFYLPQYKIGIECQGEQHFIKANKFNRKRTLKEIINQDLNKNNLCKLNNVELLYYTTTKINSLAKEKPSFYTNNLFTSTNEIIQKIRDTK